MNLLTLYHGSNHILKTPKFGEGNINNDYGQGFYCTDNIELAKEWACRNGGGCFVNSYHIDLEKLKILDLTSDNLNVLHWITILIENRKLAMYYPIMELAADYLISNYHLDLSKYDVVIGYRADDSYFSYARDFISNAVTIETLNKAIRLGNLGMQYFIRSKKAFDRFEFLGYEEVDFDKYHVKSLTREMTARKEYEILRGQQGFTGTFISSIIENGVSK